MEILGIGAPELIFIVIIALIVLGPKDMQKAGKTIGRWLNDLVRSDGWKAFQQTSKEIRTLPNKLMREANMEMMEAEKDLRKVMDTTPKASASPSNPNLPRVQGSENTIQPPPAKTPEAESKAKVETKTETGTDTDQHD
jgi:sec-independent protein translocase protein TatB